jgi:hypothetical protein
MRQKRIVQSSIFDRYAEHKIGRALQDGLCLQTQTQSSHHRMKSHHRSPA